jgi:hypothetical protein
VSGLKIYVAGSSDNRERVKYCISQLRLHNIECTSSWVTIIENEQHGVPNPGDAKHEDRFRWASHNIEDINRAHLLWFLVPALPTVTRGGWFELGYAYAKISAGAPLVAICSGETKQSVFTAFHQEFADDQAALRWIFANEHNIYKNGEDLALVSAFKAVEKLKSAFKATPIEDPNVEALTKEIARYIARYDCKNPDPEINPIELLRSAWSAIGFLDDEIDRLERSVENLRNTTTDEVVELRAKLIEFDAQCARIEQLPPWIKAFLGP